MLKKLWLGIGVALIVLIVLDLLCAIGFLFLSKPPATDSEKRLFSDVFAGVPWAKDYFAEHDAAEGMRWEPFVYWRRNYFHGKYIDVDMRGLRETVLPPAAAGEDVTARRPRIFLFGGSTMWGTGVRNEGTVPSLLAAELHRRGIDASVVNYGESGYVSTQELIQFELELRDGRVPAIAIFLDGVNDAFSTFQQNRAGIAQNESHREREFNLVKTKKLPSLQRTALAATIEGLAIVRALELVLPRSSSPLIIDYFDAEPDLATQTANSYFGNLRVLRGLAREHHCELLAYLQPTVFQKDLHSHSEAIAAEHDEKLGAFLSHVYAAIRSNPGVADFAKEFRDLSDLFRKESAPLFMDWCHLCEAGNARIAAKMADDVTALLNAH